MRESSAEISGVLEGQWAVITGGGTSVGAAIALALAAKGANICLIGRRLGVLEAVASKAAALGSVASCYSEDLASADAPRALLSRLKRELKHIDILVLSAGTHTAGPIESASLADFETVYRINVRAPYALVQAFLPMLKEGHGQVVFINSSRGIVAGPLSAQYDASKHALKALADSLRAEVNAHGVRVLSVYPGRTASELQERVHKAENKKYRPELLLQPEDVASVILNALCLPRTAEVTDIHIRPMVKT